MDIEPQLQPSLACEATWRSCYLESSTTIVAVVLAPDHKWRRNSRLDQLQYIIASQGHTHVRPRTPLASLETKVEPAGMHEQGGVWCFVRGPSSGYGTQNSTPTDLSRGGIAFGAAPAH